MRFLSGEKRNNKIDLESLECGEYFDAIIFSIGAFLEEWKGLLFSFHSAIVQCILEV